MTKHEEIKKVIFGLQFLKEKLYNGIFSDRLDCIDYAISAIKELQMYKDNKLCLVPEDVYSRQCCELDAYKEIGTVEEFREAVEKQKAKNPIPINYQDYADKIDNAEFFEGSYFCPNCGTVLRSGSYCNRCGQKLGWNENLARMEYE